jgi:hypothetical protein
MRLARPGRPSDCRAVPAAAASGRRAWSVVLLVSGQRAAARNTPRYSLQFLTRVRGAFNLHIKTKKERRPVTTKGSA